MGRLSWSTRAAIAVLIATANCGFAWLHFDCVSFCVLFGIGSTLWLDRQIFRVLGIPSAEPWKKEIRTRLLFFALGALPLKLILWRSLRWSEALFLGCTLTALVFWVEWLAAALVQSLPIRWRPADPAKPSVPLVLVHLAAILPIVAFGLPLFSFHPLHLCEPLDPQAAGIVVENVAFTTSDGLTLRGWFMPVEHARGSVLFCHGHTGNRGHVGGLYATLHELKLNILTFDFRGHGESSGRTASFGFRETQDMYAAKAALDRRFPMLPTFILGISYGASIALQAIPQMEGIRAMWLEVPFTDFITIGELKFSFLPMPARNLLLDVYSGIVRLDCGFWPRDIKSIDKLAGVRIPLHVIHGLADDLIPVSNSQRLEEIYQGPKEFVWVKDGTHADFYTKIPDRTDRLRRFIERNL